MRQVSSLIVVVVGALCLTHLSDSLFHLPYRPLFAISLAVGVAAFAFLLSLLACCGAVTGLSCVCLTSLSPNALPFAPQNPFACCLPMHPS